METAFPRRAPFWALPALVALGLTAAALLIAFVVNVVELDAFLTSAYDVPFSWDPTGTAMKYLVLAGATVALTVLAAIMHRRTPKDIPLISALLLALAMPTGAAALEYVSRHWGIVAWVLGESDDRVALERDPRVFLSRPRDRGDGRSPRILAVRVRSDLPQLGQILAVATGPEGRRYNQALIAEQRTRMLTGVGWGAVSLALLTGGLVTLRRMRLVGD